MTHYLSLFGREFCSSFSVRHSTSAMCDLGIYFTCNACRMIILSFFIVSCLAVPSRTLGLEPGKNVRYASVTIQYRDIKTGQYHNDKRDDRDATYGTTGSLRQVTGRLIHVRSKNNSKGCSDFENEIPLVKWVALIKRGECRFHDKIYKAAKQYNASAVVIYNHEERNDVGDLRMKHSDDVVSIFVKKELGEHLGQIVDAGNIVTIKIDVSQNQHQQFLPASISKTSVLFVSISFIVLMIISLAWLVFYYIQRFRYAHAKERLSRRLANAAKKAISRIPQKTVKAGDKELDRDYDQCAVCIEVYKSADVIRILPCKHVFHKSCVDPWLMDQRSCPMCKMDILRAFGLQLNGSQESVVHVEAESVTVSGIEPEPLSSPCDEAPSGTTTSGTSGTPGPKLMQFSHPSVQFHSAPDHDPDIVATLEGEADGTPSEATREATPVADERHDVGVEETQSLMFGEETTAR